MGLWSLVVLTATMPAAHPGAPAPGLPPLPALRRTAADRNKDGWILLKLGRKILKEGAYNEAARTLRDAAACLPKLPHVRTALAAALIQTGQMAEGKRELDRVLAASPRDVEALRRLGLYYELKARSREALDVYIKAAKVVPRDQELAEKIAILSLDLGKRAEALSAFERLLKLNWKNITALVNLAGIYERRGALAKAEWMHRRILALYPKRWSYWARLARFYRSQGRLTEAAQAQAKVEQLQPIPKRTEKVYRELRLRRPSPPAAIKGRPAVPPPRSATPRGAIPK